MSTTTQLEVDDGNAGGTDRIREFRNDCNNFGNSNKNPDDDAFNKNVGIRIVENDTPQQQQHSNPIQKSKIDKTINRGGGGGGGNKFNFRAPSQFGQNNNKKIWNKKFKLRQKIFQINKADMENIQNLKNQANNRSKQGPGGSGSGSGVGGIGIGGVNLGNVSSVGGSGGIGIGTIGNGLLGGQFSIRSKFFLPDKRPRKEIIIPPTKFLLGGNISDPLNLNSLQDEAFTSNTTPPKTPKQSPITTPPKVEVIIPPNINDPLHLLDPVDSIEYEKQLVSPMKRKSKSKHRNRKKKPKKRKRVSLSSSLSTMIGTKLITAQKKSEPLPINTSDTNVIPSIDGDSTSDRVGFNSSTVVPHILDASPNETIKHNFIEGDSSKALPHVGDLISSQKQIGDDEENSLNLSKNASGISGGENDESFASKLSLSGIVGGGGCLNSEISILGKRSLDREKNAKELRLELGGIIEQQHTICGNAGSGRKRRISEGPNLKNKFRRTEMDKIVSPVVPQPGAWKRPPRTVPTGGRKTSRVRSTSVSETEVISPTDETKTIETDSIRDDTPDLEIQQKQDDLLSSRTEKNLNDNNSNVDDKIHLEQPHNKMVPKKPEEKSHQQQQEHQQKNNMPKFKPEGEKYQYGNYDRYSGYRYLNEFMDVRLQVFNRHSHLFHNKDILDIGCNVGHMTIAVSKNLSPKSILGIDIDNNLVLRAKRNLSRYVPIPPNENVSKTDQTDEKNVQNPKQISGIIQQNEKYKKNSNHRRKSLPKQKSNKDKNGDFFPISFSICYGTIPSINNIKSNSELSPENKCSNLEQKFPYNISFRHMNYVPKDESLLNNDTQQYDIIMCLSVTKWIHLNFGDVGLKSAFKRMFNQLRPGGKLILEAQNWASYKKKKNLTETIYKNYRSIEFFPNKFHEYLLSNEVGFSHSYVLGVPRHLSKGFCRPIQLYAKGDYTPNHIRWSDNYHPQTPYEAYRGIYAGMPRHPSSRPIWGYDTTPHGNSGGSGSYSCRQTPHYGLSTSQYYNPLETDSYLPSYDTEVQNRHYVFASPLYQTVWSPPASLKNSSSHTPPAFNSVRESDIDEDAVENYRHVYPPTDCGTSTGGAFNSIREADVEDCSQQTTVTSHVYANCDSSSSPKIDSSNETSPNTCRLSGQQQHLHHHHHNGGASEQHTSNSMASENSVGSELNNISTTNSVVSHGNDCN